MPNLRSAANFVLFTSVGALSNAGVSNITGNIGTNTGLISGFGPPTTLIGTIDSGNAVTIQCKADLQAAYDQLFNTTATNSSHAPAYGSGETLFPGVYAISAAGSVAGNLTLDAQGDPNAIFIFKFGGAFTTGASTTVSLINSASSCRIFWIAEGAISMGASTTMKGTMIANNDAVSMGAGGALEGRLMSTAGAASVNQVLLSQPCPFYVLPIGLYSFEGRCAGQIAALKWVTANEAGNSFFTIERSTNAVQWQVAGTVPGAGNSLSQSTYTFTDNLENRDGFLYRIKQTDLNGSYSYTQTIRVKRCENNAADVASVFPNPTKGKFVLQYAGLASEVHSIDIINSTGQKLYRSNGLQTNFDLTGFVPGVYFVRIQLSSKFFDLQIVVVK